MMVSGFPIILVIFGILVPLQRGLVLELCLQLFCLIYVSHLIFLPVLYFNVLFHFRFLSLFLLLSFGHPLNLLLGGKLFAAFPIFQWYGWLGWHDTWCVIARHAIMHPWCGPYVCARGWRRRGLCNVLLLCF